MRYGQAPWRLIGVVAVLLDFLAIGSAAASWDGGGFVQNVGQVSGGCLYYLNTPEYRLEVHAQELRIWLKDSEEYPGLKQSEAQERPGQAHVVGYFLRIPLVTGSGQMAIVAFEPIAAELRVIKGNRQCQRASGFQRLTVRSGGWNGALSLTAAAGAVLFERFDFPGATDTEPAAPWLVEVGEARSRLATCTPILDGSTQGVLIEPIRHLKAAASSPLLSQPQTTPTLLWSTFVGGESEDFARDVMACADGSLLLAGPTYSVQFPTTPGAYDTTLAYDEDAYVAKLASNGGALLWSTLIGGQDQDEIGEAILAGGDEVVITGVTRSADFPTTPGAFDEVINGAPHDPDIFVTRLAADGNSLVWSTFLGGDQHDWGYTVSEDENGNLVVGGYSSSLNFPITAGAYQTIHAGETWSADAVIAKLSGNGSSLLWATFLGGGAAFFPDDRILDMAVMADGTIVAYGCTYCPDFPVTAGAFQTTIKGAADLFVSRISGDGRNLVWSTFLGGSNYEFCMDMTIAPSGAIILGGSTQSTDFPVTVGAFDRIPSQYYTGFVARMADDGSRLVWSSFVGGQLRRTGLPGESYVWPVSVGDDGTVWAAGYTDCVDFPTSADAYDRTFGGVYDAFVIGLTSDGASRVWGSYIGGTSDEAVRAMVCDGRGRMILGVSAWSGGYPVTAGAYDTTHNSPGLSDVAVTVFQTRPVPVILAAFSAERQGAVAAIRWRLAELMDVAGFEVWRAPGPAEARTLVGAVEADPTGSYVVIDPAPESGSAEYWLRAVSAGGEAGVWYGPACLAAAALPQRLVITSGAPNPFNPRTTIRYGLPQAAHVTLSVFDQRGRLVRTLVNGALPAGEHSVDWDGQNSRGQSAASGTYVLRLATEQGARMSKVTLAR